MVPLMLMDYKCLLKRQSLWFLQIHGYNISGLGKSHLKDCLYCYYINAIVRNKYTHIVSVTDENRVAVTTMLEDNIASLCMFLAIM